MDFIVRHINCPARRISLNDESGREIARAYLFMPHNDLHEERFGFMEDVYVEKEHRSKGIGDAIVRKLIEVAKEEGLYKIVATSRYKRTRVHDLYIRLGFKDHGKEFRYDIITFDDPGY